MTGDYRTLDLEARKVAALERIADRLDEMDEKISRVSVAVAAALKEEKEKEARVAALIYAGKHVGVLSLDEK